MKKNVIVQLSLLILGLLLIFFTYYAKEKKDEFTIDTKALNEKTSKLTDDKTNILENIEYIGTDNRGSTFKIAAGLAEVYAGKADLSYMKNVNAKITLNDGRVIMIRSDRAIYNRINNDTQFMNNVVITQSDNIITSDNLDLYASKSLITIFNNIKYKGNKGLLIADKIDINLLNKETNVYMYDKKKKVQAQFIN